jgi:hypothetical protein
MRGSRLLACGVLSAALLTAVPEQGHAQTLQSCLAQQIRYAGTTCRGLARCYVKAIRKGLSVEQSCLDEREAEVQARYNLIESQGDCLTEPAGATVANMLTSFVDAQVAATPGVGPCESGKVGAIGRACKQMFACYARATEGSEPAVDPFCLDKSSAKMTDVYERLEEKHTTTCDTSDDADDREADTLQATEDIYDYLRGIGTTTTTTSMSTSTTTLPPSCPEDGSFTACVAYRDNGACQACVDMVGGIPASQCGGASQIGTNCGDSFQNQSCAHAINAETTCGAVCCP